MLQKVNCMEKHEYCQADDRHMAREYKPVISMGTSSI